MCAPRCVRFMASYMRRKESRVWLGLLFLVCHWDTRGFKKGEEVLAYGRIGVLLCTGGLPACVSLIGFAKAKLAKSLFTLRMSRAVLREPSACVVLNFVLIVTPQAKEALVPGFLDSPRRHSLFGVLMALARTGNIRYLDRYLIGTKRWGVRVAGTLPDSSLLCSSISFFNSPSLSQPPPFFSFFFFFFCVVSRWSKRYRTVSLASISTLAELGAGVMCGQ
jgi:hypothetical protein